MLRHKWKLIPGLLLLVVYIFCLPSSLFNDPVSTVLLDRDRQLLGARIAADGQWRFPPADTVPEKFSVALTTFEDKRFFQASWYRIHWPLPGRSG